MDPITFEVIRNALVAATDEMVLTLRRSAYSTNIKTRADFSCAFFDAELRAVAQGFTQPVHLGSMVEQVPRAILDYGPENLEPGDVIITNEPFPSGVHLNDISLISPVHHDGELLGYVANLAHHVDTRSYPNGLYEVTVDVSDMRGNSSEAVLQVSIENRAGTATGCVKEFNPAACGDALL